VIGRRSIAGRVYGSGNAIQLTDASTEGNIRARLPVTRFLSAYLPLRLSRWLMSQGRARVRLPADVTCEIVCADGVPCHWLIPQNSPNDKALLYLHGGSFMLGLAPLHLQMVASLAQKMGVRALMVDCRVAPEHPFPAALGDCLTAYRWVLKQGYSAQNIVVAGDSAGGN
jgi:acetyl esterase/lipase